MKRIIVAVQDIKSESFDFPMFASTKAQAIRDFEQGCKQKETMLNLYPADFILVELGYFDTQSGELVPNKLPTPLATAAEFSAKIES